MCSLTSTLLSTLFRPLGTLVTFRRPSVLVVMFFKFFFNQTQDLRAPSADRHETLPRDHYLIGIDNSGPKFGGPPLKIWGQKTCKIWTDFTQLPTLIANISGTRQDIKNRKDM